MKKISINNRELKSFMLLYYVKKLLTFFLKKNWGFLVMTNLTCPTDRDFMYEILLPKNLYITFISKTISKFIFNKNNKYNNLKYLHFGSVFYIGSKKEENLDRTLIKFILDQKEIQIRYLLWNQTIFIQQKIQKFFTNNYSNTNVFTLFVKQRLLLNQNINFENI